MQTKTFQNLLVLEQARDTARKLLGVKYDQSVINFIKVIQMIMKANNENHFEAMKRIQEQTSLANTNEKLSLFSAALMEIVEEVNLSKIR